MEITREDLKKYENINSVSRQIRGAEDFTSEVMDYYMTGEKLNGIKLPHKEWDSKFRLRAGEISLLGGVNGAGKSLWASEVILSAMNQGYKCLSISLEMSPKSQLARMWRQASLQVEPSMEAGLQFTKWAKDKLWFYDQHGTVDPRTLMSVIRYVKDNHNVDFVLVDSLMTMSMNSDDWNGQKQVMQALANAARHLDVHVMLVTHARKGQDIKSRLSKWDISGSSDLTNRADVVFLLGRVYDAPSTDAYLSLCKARHFDGAEMDIDLRLDMASLNYYTDNQLPQKILDTPAQGGPVGELERVALNDNIHEITIRKTERAQTTAMGQVALN